jgi:hypothetical protein
MAEYNNSSVGSACNFATLGNYNSNGQLAVPVPHTTHGTSGAYVVPVFGAGLGYDALTHGNNVGSCSGFFNITKAYGAGAQNCNPQYQKSLCMPKFQ